VVIIAQAGAVATLITTLW